MKLRRKQVFVAAAIAALVYLGSVIAGCTDYYLRQEYKRLMRRDPTELDSSDRAALVCMLLCAIQDGYGKVAMTPWGESELDYYMRVLATTPTPRSSCLIYLDSGTHMYARRWGNAGEALVQEGYGQRACEAILATARGWEKQKHTASDDDLFTMQRAYDVVIQLKIRMYLHAHKDLLRRVAVADRSVIGCSPVDVLSDKIWNEPWGDAAGWLAAVDRRMSSETFQVGDIDSNDATWELLIPKLAAMNDPTFNEAYSRWQKAQKHCILEERYGQPGLIPFYVRRLKHKDEGVRSTAAYALGTMGPAAKAAVPALIQALEGDGAGPSPHWAAEALGEIGPAAMAAVPALTQALNSRSYDMRRCAADALGNLGPAANAAVPALVRNLSGGIPAMPYQAARALGKMGPAAKAAVPALIRTFKHDNEWAAGHAVWALVQIESGAGESVPVLSGLP